MNSSKNLYTNVALANIYLNPAFTSAVVSQSVLWEKLYLLQEERSFYQVACEDGYRGWIHKNQVAAADTAQKNKAITLTRSFAVFYKQPDNDSRVVRSAAAGSRLPIIEEKGKWLRCIFPDGETGWIERNAFSSLPPLNRDALTSFAERYIGTPYLWGGKTPYGFDCSGFVQFVHKMFDMEIRRDAYMQFDDAKFVSEDYRDAETGDLYFFRENNQKITHVGIAFGEGKIVHARGMVKINSLNKKDENFDADLLSTFVAVKTFL